MTENTDTTRSAAAGAPARVPVGPPHVPPRKAYVRVHDWSDEGLRAVADRLIRDIGLLAYLKQGGPDAERRDAGTV